MTEVNLRIRSPNYWFWQSEHFKFLCSPLIRMTKSNQKQKWCENILNYLTQKKKLKNTKKKTKERKEKGEETTNCL